MLLGPGTFLASGLIIKGDVVIRGAGIGATTLKLANSANVDLVVSESFLSLTGGTTRGGPENWAFIDITLDGNKANNTSGWPLRVFGAAYRMSNVEVQNGASGGVFSEWGTGGTDMEAQWSNFRIHDCSGDGIDFRGPHDSQFVNGFLFKNTGTGFKTSGNATSEQLTNIHTWGEEQDHGFHFLVPAYTANCVAEGASVANVVLDCNSGTWYGGTVYGSDTGAEIGFKFGQTTTARYWDIQGVRLARFSATGIPVRFEASAGNRILATFDAFPSTPAALYTGTPGTYDDIEFFCPQSPTLGATWSRRVSTGGFFHAYSASGVRSLLVAASANEAYIQLLESSTNGNASTNGARIMARDNGSGKTQLIVRFATGAVQVLATEP